MYIYKIFTAACHTTSISAPIFPGLGVAAGRIRIRQRSCGSGCHITIGEDITSDEHALSCSSGISLGTSDVAGGPCPMCHAGRDTSTTHQPKRFLDLLIAEGVNYGVDDRVVGGGY